MTMKITIIPADNLVGVDGEFRTVNLRSLVGTIHAVHFDTMLGKGEVESYMGGKAPVEGNITDFSSYQPCLDAWIAAVPPPPSAPPPKQLDTADVIAVLKASSPTLAAALDARLAAK